MFSVALSSIKLLIIEEDAKRFSVIKVKLVDFCGEEF